MVATRRSAGKHIDVELSDNGKELQKVIPIEKQRQSQMEQQQSSPKKDTRSRIKKTRHSDVETISPNGSDSSNLSSFTKLKSQSSITIKRTETRGRKRKIQDASDNNPHKDEHDQMNSKKSHIDETLDNQNQFLSLYHQKSLHNTYATSSVSPKESNNNMVADKHKINHLLTSDSPPSVPKPLVANNYNVTSSLPKKPLPPTNLITVPAPQLLNTPTPIRPILPTPRTSSISTMVNSINMSPQLTNNNNNTTGMTVSVSSSSSPTSIPKPVGIVNSFSSSSSSGQDGNNAVPLGPQMPLTTITKHSDGRIPITSIISQKIDSQDIPMLLDDESPGSNNDNKKTKRRYRVDRDNIKINKRIMSQDTEDVIKMFKKFDDEVLTNAEARARLLNLGFETRKRYITTFKHYIRFCCKKKLDHFFVTGELMREFYEEQFALSSSNKPVIRLRKMDPAFSKLQEINFLVYHLENKDIPNRQLALEYLVYQELGQEPPPLERANYIPSPAFPKISTDQGNQTPVKSPNDNDAPDYSLKKKQSTSHSRLLRKPSIASVTSSTPQRPITSQVPHTSSPSLTILQEPFEQGNDISLVKVPEVQDSNQPSSVSSSSSSSSSLSSSSSSSTLKNETKKRRTKNDSKKYQKQKRSNSEDTLSSDNNNNNNGNNSHTVKSKYFHNSYKKLKKSIEDTLRQHVSVDPAFISNLASCIDKALYEFECENNLQPILELNNNGIPILDLNNKIYTVYEIIEEWYKIEPCIADRLKNWGEDWIRDSIDHNTFLERKSVVEFVEKMSKELNIDIFTIANDCDRYIHDKSIIQEFIAEIDLDVEDLFKKVLRYRQRRN